MTITGLENLTASFFFTSKNLPKIFSSNPACAPVLPNS